MAPSDMGLSSGFADMVSRMEECAEAMLANVEESDGMVGETMRGL
jgi:hypothetical protein